MSTVYLIQITETEMLLCFPVIYPTRSIKTSMSPSSRWHKPLVPCSIWLVATSGASWRTGCTRWSLNWICPLSSRTTCSWITEVTSTESIMSAVIPDECCCVWGRCSCSEFNNSHLVIKVDISTAALVASTLLNSKRVLSLTGGSCSLFCHFYFNLVSFPASRLILHHKRALQTRVDQVSGYANICFIFYFSNNQLFFWTWTALDNKEARMFVFL